MSQKKILATALVFLLVLLTNASSLYAQKIYLLAAGTGNDSATRNCVTVGIATFTDLLRDNLPPSQLVIYNAPSSDWKGVDLPLSKNKGIDLVNAIKTCPATEKDALVLFWFGPRGMDNRDFVLLLDSDNKNDKISRTELVRTLQEKQVRLACLITDSARMFRKFPPALKINGCLNTKQITNLMDDLFFKSSGLLDINSTSDKQYSIILDRYGSGMLEIFHELIECHDYKNFNWSDFIDEANRQIAENFPKHHQTITSFSLPNDLYEKMSAAQISSSGANTAAKETANEALSPTRSGAEGSDQARSDQSGNKGQSAIPGYSNRSNRSGRSQRSHGGKSLNHEKISGWQNRWDAYQKDYEKNHLENDAGSYPQNYSFANRLDYNEDSFGGWSAPVYHAEAGDYLLGINGQRIFNYNQFIAAIQSSPSLIYLTFLDRRYGEIYELRTFMGPSGSRIRLGLSVVNDLFGAVRVTGTAFGSPASRCQYRYGYYERRPYPVPVPVPVPDPDPNPPIPVPVPGPQPQPYNPDPTPDPMPDPAPAPDSASDSSPDSMSVHL